jgi:hypothetical protein
MAARKAVWDYVNGKKVIAIAAEFEVARAAVNQWLAGTTPPGPRRCGPARPPVQRPGSAQRNTRSSRGCSRLGRRRRATLAASGQARGSAI